MRMLLASLPLLAIVSMSTVAHADDQPRYKFLGVEGDISVPSGVALGVTGRVPYAPWFKLGVSATYTLAPGVRGNLLIDPVKFVIAPVVNVDVGWQPPFTVPGVKGNPGGQFTYEDLQGGIALGKRDGFRFLLMGGMSHLDGSTSNFNNVVNVSGASIGNPNFSVWIPNAKIGFNCLF